MALTDKKNVALPINRVTSHASIDIILLSMVPQCPVCMEACLKEIYQCNNGHIICGNCDENRVMINPCCPTCRIPMGLNAIRVRALEDLVKLQVSFPNLLPLVTVCIELN